MSPILATWVPPGKHATSRILRPTGRYWLDPVVSAAIDLVIVPRTVSLLRQSGHILLEGSPRDVDLEALRRRILSIPGVEKVHDMHLWTLTSGVISASVDVGAAADRSREEIARSVRKLFEDDAGAEHATIEVETGSTGECREREKHP